MGLNAVSESILSFFNGLKSQSMCNERGLSYGDGFFETIRCHGASAPLWELHCARMLSSAKRLGINLTRAQLDDTLSLVFETLAFSTSLFIVKIILTRSSQVHSSGNRGSYGAVGVSANIVVDVFAFSDREYHKSGLSLRLCELPLPHTPLLAGMKHLNRLNYILLANTVNLEKLEQVLFVDEHGFIIETMHHNVFVVNDGRVKTPPLEAVGVRGVMRQCICDMAPDIGLKEVSGSPISIDDVKIADEVFVTNAVDGVVSVTEFNTGTDKIIFSDRSVCESLKVKLKFFYETGSAIV